MNEYVMQRNRETTVGIQSQVETLSTNLALCEFDGKKHNPSLFEPSTILCCGIGELALKKQLVYFWSNSIDH